MQRSRVDLATEPLGGRGSQQWGLLLVAWCVADATLIRDSARHKREADEVSRRESGQGAFSLTPRYWNHFIAAQCVSYRCRNRALRVIEDSVRL
jgi:hypothetical protein